MPKHAAERDKKARYSIDDLNYLMTRLRDPATGCPWDIKQTFESIVPHTLEEAYEVADAMESGDRNDMRDELGDLLFQVIFYARIGEEEGSFDFTDITNAITTKLLRRHPHVFPNRDLAAHHPEGTTFSDDQIKGQWDKIKAEERALKAAQAAAAGKLAKAASILDDIPNALPALGRAEKLQRRASNVGFDWDNVDDVFAKIQEEIGEIREVLALRGQRETSDFYADPKIHKRLTDEVGDLLFCGVNLARFLKVNPDEALRSCNAKFTSRFNFIEQTLAEKDKAFEDCTLRELDALWNQAKDA